jgi:hypothetical protein
MHYPAEHSNIFGTASVVSTPYSDFLASSHREYIQDSFSRLDPAGIYGVVHGLVVIIPPYRNLDILYDW